MCSVGLLFRRSKQGSWFNPERLQELLNNGDCGITTPALDVAHIGAVDAGAISIILLAPAFLAAKATDVLTKAHGYVHALLKRRVSPFYLQTMSDIYVDCAADLRLRGSPIVDTCHMQEGQRGGLYYINAVAGDGGDDRLRCQRQAPDLALVADSGPLPAAGWPPCGPWHASEGALPATTSTIW